MKVLLVAASAVLTSCSSSGGAQSLPATLAYKSRQCLGEAEPIARWISSQSDWEAAYHRINGERAGGGSPQAVDFSTQGVLLIGMGSRATGGYEVGPGGDSPVLRDGVLHVSVEWAEPPQGTVVTQAVTSPCFALVMKAVDFERIEVADTKGQVKISTRR